MIREVHDRVETGETAGFGAGESAGDGVGEGASVGPDLRRRRQAALVEKVLRLATSLPSEDRALLESIYREGRTAVQVSHLTRQPARTIRRRVRRIVHRMVSPEFAFVALHRERWPVSRRRIADACVLEGLSMCQAADRLRVSFHNVRRHMEVLAGLFEAAHPEKRWVTPSLVRGEDDSSVPPCGGGGA